MDALFSHLWLGVGVPTSYNVAQIAPPDCPPVLHGSNYLKTFYGGCFAQLLARYRHKTNVNSHYIPSMLGPNMRHSGNNSSAPRGGFLITAQPQFDTQTLLFTFDRLMPETTRPVEKKHRETRNIYMVKTNWFAQIVHKIHQWSNTSDKAPESHQGVFSGAPSFSFQWFMTFMEPNHANES